MSISRAEIAGLIAAAEGAATAFGQEAYERRFFIDAPKVVDNIERLVVRCSQTIRRCLTHMVSMDLDNMRACIDIANGTVRTLRSVQRLLPETDRLENLLILEDLFYEEHLAVMYAEQTDYQIKQNMFKGLPDLWDDGDRWWRGDQH